MLIDSECGQNTEAILTNIRNLGFDDQQVAAVFNTHCHYRHSGGNAKLNQLITRHLQEIFYSVFDEQGNYLGVTGIFQDVGEKVSLLKQLGKFEEPRVFGIGGMRPRSIA